MLLRSLTRGGAVLASAVAGVALTADVAARDADIPKKRARLAVPALGFSTGALCEGEAANFGDIAAMTIPGAPPPTAPPPPEPLLAVEGLTNPGDFEDLDDAHGFRVQELDGVFLMLISMIGGHEREPAMFQMQYTLNASSADAAFVINDARSPATQVMVTPAQPGSGRMLQVTNTLRPAGGVTLKTEVVVSPSQVMGANVSVKHDGADFHSELTLSQGQQGPTAEASYHQAVTPQVTAGGSVSTQLGALLPVPDVKQLGWGAFGSWHDARREKYVLGRYDAASGRLSGKYWHQAHKTLALGTSVSAAVGGDWASTASVGAKYTLGGDTAPSTLTAQLSTDLKASLAWQKVNSNMSQNISGTFFQTTVSGVYDHANQEHKLGLQVIAQY